MSDTLASYGITSEMTARLEEHAIRDPLTLSASLPNPSEIDFRGAFGHHKNVVRQALAIASAFKLFEAPRFAVPNDDGTVTFFGRLRIGLGELGEFQVVERTHPSCIAPASGMGYVTRDEELERLLACTSLLSKPTQNLPGSLILGQAEYRERIHFLDAAIKQIGDRDYLTGPSEVAYAAGLNGMNRRAQSIASGHLRRMMRPDLREVIYSGGRTYGVAITAYQKLAELSQSDSLDDRRRTIADLWKDYRPAVVLCLRMRQLTWVTDANRFHDEIENFPMMLHIKGHAPAVWRMLLKMTNGQLKMLTVNAGAKSLDRIAQLHGETVPATALKIIHEVKATHLKAYMDAARKARKQGRVRMFVHEAEQVIDMIERGGHDLPENLSWERLSQLSDAWHQWISRQTKRDTSYKWEPLLGDVEDGALAARELLNTEELMKEGNERDHCVGSYDRNCYSGQRRIYALSFTTATGKVRSSTLEVRWDGVKWTVGQNRSTSNSVPVPELLTFGQTLVRKINRMGASRDKPMPVGTVEAIQDVVLTEPNPLGRYPAQNRNRAFEEDAYDVQF